MSRSAKKPTAVSAATASVTATISRRSSPARRSRQSVRQPSCQEGTRVIGASLPQKTQPGISARTAAAPSSLRSSALQQRAGSSSPTLICGLEKPSVLAGLDLALPDHGHGRGKRLLERVGHGAAARRTGRGRRTSASSGGRNRRRCAPRRRRSSPASCSPASGADPAAGVAGGDRDHAVADAGRSSMRRNSPALSGVHVQGLVVGGRA